VVCPQCGTQNENRSDACVRCKKPLHPDLMRGKIPCNTHANREATTSCALCGTRLCAACAVAMNAIDYCESCAPASAIRESHDEDYEKIAVLNTEEVSLAGFDSRLFAGLVDFGILLAGTGLVVLALWLFTGGHLEFLRSAKDQPIAFYFLRFLVLLSVPLYLFLPIALSGQTVGHKLCSVVVLQPDGHIVTINQALLRTLFQVISALPLGLGFVWMIWDKESLTWHDRWSGTRAYEWQDAT